MAMLKGRWGSPSVTKKRLMAKSGGFVRQVRNGFYYEGKTCVKRLSLEKVILCRKDNKKVGIRSYVI